MPSPFAKSLLALAAASLLMMPIHPALAARFLDVSGNFAERQINELSDRGIIPADSEGKFHPEEPVTRAWLAYWLVAVLGLENQPVPSSPSFSDVKPSDWFYKSVEIIRQNNYISGYVDGFRPNQFIQKGEVLCILVRTLAERAPDEQQIERELARYKDGSKVPPWARAGVAQAALAGLLVNNPDPSVINATKLASRADTIALLYNLDHKLARRNVQEVTQEALSPPSAYPTQSTPFRGQVSEQGYAQPAPYQGRQGYAQPSYPPAAAYPPQQGYAGQMGGYGQGQPGYPSGGPPNYLQGHVAVVAAGTQFQAALKNSIDSGASQPGEEISATLTQPLYSGSVPVVPAGSRLIGQITNVVSAKHFRFGANGHVEMRFTALETPDGRRFPLSASVSQQFNLSGGTAAGRVGKTALGTGVGAAGGAALGTALGAIVGATSGSRSVGRATGMGAVFGTALGAGTGLVGSGYRKGSEVRIPAGTSIPIQLDQSLQVSAGGQPVPQPFYGSPAGQYQQPNYGSGF